MKKILLIILLFVSATAMCQTITIDPIPEKINNDEDFTIKWKQEKSDKKTTVKIELLIYKGDNAANVDSTALIKELVESKESNEYKWSVKGDNDKNYQIKITTLNVDNMSDVSNSFKITKKDEPIVVTTGDEVNKGDTKEGKNESSPIKPSLLSMKFIVNKDTSSLRKMNIYEKDIITIVIENIPNKLSKKYFLKQTDVKDLSSAIKLGQTVLQKNVRTDILPTDSDDPASVTFIIANLDQGKAYKFLVMNDSVIEDQFYVDVNEIIHFEINIGPIFSTMPNPDFKEFPVTKDATGNVDTALIKDNGTNSQFNLVLGGVFHPWGYDPRADISFRNFFLYLGVPFGQTLFENGYFGFGVGARGFSLVFGAYVAKLNRLTNGYYLDTRYAKKDFELEKIVKKEYMIKLFAGVVLDLDIVGKIFTSINK